MLHLFYWLTLGFFGLLLFCLLIASIYVYKRIVPGDEILYYIDGYTVKDCVRERVHDNLITSKGRELDFFDFIFGRFVLV